MHIAQTICNVQPGEEEKGLLGKMLDKLRALFRKKQAVAVKEEVKEDEGAVEEEEDCDNKEESKKDKWFVKVYGFCLWKKLICVIFKPLIGPSLCKFFWQNWFVWYLKYTQHSKTLGFWLFARRIDSKYASLSCDETMISLSETTTSEPNTGVRFDDPLSPMIRKHTFLWNFRGWDSDLASEAGEN